MTPAPTFRNEHINETARIGDVVRVRCLSTNKVVEGVVRYSGPSSTPGCWVVNVTPSTPWPCAVAVAWRRGER